LIRYLARRLALAVPTTLAAVLVVFVAIRLLPNNPVLTRFGQHAVPEKVELAMKAQGWDQPVWKQTARFFWRVVTSGDLGTSFTTPERVSAGLLRTFPATIELACVALCIALPLGIAAGVAAAVWRNRFPDYLCMTGSLLGVSVPVFFLGICLIAAFPSMPTSGRLPTGMWFERDTEFILIESLVRGRWDVFFAALRHICLPAIALSTVPMPLIARITRSSMLEVLSSDFIRTARAKGNPPWRVIWRHAFPNASIPVVNIGGMQVAQLLTGAVLTESVFSWPGLGRYLVEAVLRSDYNVVQGATLLIAAVFVLSNLAVDAVYAGLDPRLRIAEGANG
jgi:ABC-type dipeptide/oligopeptide/nickel transport system permease component